jgi:hypothetical protein
VFKEERDMPWIIDFFATGDNFKPSQVNYPFTRSIDAGTLELTGRNKNNPAPYGSIVIQVPKHIPNQERITYITTTAHAILPDIIHAGATEWEINVGRFYNTQCNEELSSEQLAQLASLNCPFLYSAYKVSKREEKRLEKEYGGYSESM